MSKSVVNSLLFFTFQAHTRPVPRARGTISITRALHASIAAENSSPGRPLIYPTLPFQQTGKTRENSSGNNFTILLQKSGTRLFFFVLSLFSGACYQIRSNLLILIKLWFRKRGRTCKLSWKKGETGNGETQISLIFMGGRRIFFCFKEKNRK